MWDLTPSELASVSTGIGAHRTWIYELALFTAWHVAAFNSQAKVGKLKPWSQYRQQVSGRSEAPPQLSWQQRKAARQHEVELFKKHQQQRKTPPKERRG